jgi:hypothetical protein
MKNFLFLYPIKEYIEAVCERRSALNPNYENEWCRDLKECIHLRYKSKGFSVNYALFDDTPLHQAFNPNDGIIRVGMTFEEHTTPKDGKYNYPDENRIIKPLLNSSELVVAGFHLGDCVDRVAKAAHNKGINTLVDEELTELFGYLKEFPSFHKERFPSIIPNERWNEIEEIIQYRKNRPWLYQFTKESQVPSSDSSPKPHRKR